MHQSSSNIPIDINSTVSYIFKLLEEYDKNLNKDVYLPSPYTEQIYIRMEDGRLTEVSPDVQYEAVQKWEEIKNYENLRKIRENVLRANKNNLNNKNKYQNICDKKIYFEYAIYFVIFVLVMYFCYLLKN